MSGCGTRQLFRCWTEHSENGWRLPARERGFSRKTELRPAQRRAAADGRLKSSAGWCVGYGCVLGLGAARPIEPVIEANDDRVEIGANADRRNGVEIVILAPEVIEIILDLAGEIFH